MTQQQLKTDLLTEVNQNQAGRSGCAPGAAAGAAAVAGAPLPSSSGVPINEQMSRSMHEARNQIFDLQDKQDQNKRRQKGLRHAEALQANSDKIYPQIAYALDPHYNVLWVYDGAARKLRCYNVLASEMANSAMVFLK